MQFISHAIFVAFYFGNAVDAFGYIPSKDAVPLHVISRMPHNYLHRSSLPNEFDWKSLNGTVYVTRVGNQLQPKPCGSCWAHGATGALSDRFKIAMKASVPDINLSPQVLLNCGPVEKFGSCSGGDHVAAYKFIYENGITDETCVPYESVDQTNWAEIPCKDRMCRTCDIHGNCYFIKGIKYEISEYGTVTGEDQMMAEIYARGPIACLMYAHTSAFQNYTGGIIDDSDHYNNSITHVVAVTGWGTDEQSGLPFWSVRNSFGTHWGEVGWFKLRRGTNCLNIESHVCSWAVPKL
ncbi:cathepsin Z-like [Corticium candelabrum]|uniref:cathepsin Z-like n=1 Tax=Corticium candelabrum TaxID=121492 RepID=UPI002E26A696|nr:cathepsin Z-like [Corticium candelabrum]XP_062516276.1 cathepsin Z-like [Corticium candelabrum]XP_062516277.1 cathepsin Z-like [Corticium candelabrum]